ncbi:hypothetical protein MN608_11680 [Microdochium nivale]|nr:hypothetical protein MN608_11680 [Microdochium nivale]
MSNTNYLVQVSLAGFTAASALSFGIANLVVLRRVDDDTRKTFRTVTNPLLLLFIGTTVALAGAVYGRTTSSSSNNISTATIVAAIGTAFIRFALLALLRACLLIGLGVLALYRPGGSLAAARRWTASVVTLGWLLALASAVCVILIRYAAGRRIPPYLPSGLGVAFNAVLVLGFAVALWPAVATMRAAKRLQQQVPWSVNIPACLIAAATIAWLQAVLSLAYSILVLRANMGAAGPSTNLLAQLSVAVQAVTYLLPLISLIILFGAGVHTAKHGLWRGRMTMAMPHHDQAASAYEPATTTAGGAAGLHYVDPYERQRQEYYFAAQQGDGGGGGMPVEMPHYGQQHQHQKTPHETYAGWHEQHHNHGQQQQPPPPPPGYEMDAQGRYGHGQVPQPMGHR